MKKQPKRKYSCLVYYSEDDKCWIAHSLTLDLIGTGNFATEAFTDMRQAVDHQFELVKKQPDIQLYRKAPLNIIKKALQP